MWRGARWPPQLSVAGLEAAALSQEVLSPRESCEWNLWNIHILSSSCCVPKPLKPFHLLLTLNSIEDTVTYDSDKLFLATGQSSKTVILVACVRQQPIDLRSGPMSELLVAGSVAHLGPCCHPITLLAQITHTLKESSKAVEAPFA